MKKYIYIAGGTPRSQSLTTSVSGDDQKFVITDAGFGLTVADINSDQDENIFKNGAIVVDLLVHANHAGNFGSHYGTPTAGTKVRIHPNALTYDGTSKIIVAAKSADAVYGITMSDTEGDNHIDVIQKQPLASQDATVFNSELFLGINKVDDTTVDVFFEPHTNDGMGSGSDKARFTISTGKFKEFCQCWSDMLLNRRNQPGMVVFADQWNGVYYNSNAGSIEAVAITLDT